jgi:hypothetical protein
LNLAILLLRNDLGNGERALMCLADIRNALGTETKSVECAGRLQGDAQERLVVDVRLRIAASGLDQVVVRGGYASCR